MPSRLVVLMSFGEDDLRAGGNPFSRLLVESLPPHVKVRTFSWRTALLGRYDVLHFHWPEHLLRSGGWKAPIHVVAMHLLILRLRLGRAVAVQTVHNETPHGALGPYRIGLLRKLARVVRWRFVMNPGDVAAHRPNVTYIPHGHYRGAYPSSAIAPEPRTLLFFGTILPYKGLDRLVQEFVKVEATRPLRLRVLGQDRDGTLARESRELMDHDERIEADLRRVSDIDLARSIESAEAVVLPYNKLLNSGAAILALSLNRPVILPSSATTESLLEEFGPEWVRSYESPLTVEDLHEIDDWLHERERRGPLGEVSMARRDWPEIGRETVDGYAAAIDEKRPRTDVRG